MYTKTKYVAKDGSEWENEEGALNRENLIDEVNKIMQELKPTPTKLNWKGYIQQNPSVVESVKRKLYNIANRDGILKWWLDYQKTEHGNTDESLIKCHPSWFCRMLDGSHTPLDKAYSRLWCIDDNCREYNQPYYALHPEEAGDEYQEE